MRPHCSCWRWVNLRKCIRDLSAANIQRSSTLHYKKHSDAINGLLVGRWKKRHRRVVVELCTVATCFIGAIFTRKVQDLSWISMQTGGRYNYTFRKGHFSIRIDRDWCSNPMSSWTAHTFIPLHNTDRFPNFSWSGPFPEKQRATEMKSTFRSAHLHYLKIIPLPDGEYAKLGVLVYFTIKSLSRFSSLGRKTQRDWKKSYTIAVKTISWVFFVSTDSI